MKILSYRRFALWWQLAMDWFQRQFAAIAASIDLSPVEEKLDGIDGKIGTPADGQPTTLFGAIAAGGSGDDAHNLAAFFGLPESLPEYHAMTEAEVLEIADEEWQAMYGFVAVPNTVHTVDAGGSERVFTTYMNPNKTYADYGWPALWDAQGVTIALTDHPTAGRVIYTFNPIND